MRLYKSLFTLTIVLLFSTCAEKPTEVKTTGEVQGRVLDIKTGAGIENATVTIPTISDKLTDISGFYQFKDIEEGTYSFVAEKTGYVSEIKQIVIEVNETKEVNFQLMKDEPVLSVAPTQINFGNTETEQPVSITNTGTGALTWTASENLNWLSLSPTSGSVNAEDTTSTTVSVTRAGLDQGSYEGEIAFVSNGGNDTVQVQMEVVPTLVVSESSLDFGTELTSLTLTVTNPSGGILEWAAAGNASWLTVSPNSGTTQTEDDVLTILVNRTGLDGGDYSSTVTITSNGGNYTVTVTMRVPLPPELSVSPASLNFGASTSTMNLNISNNGDGVLTWNVAADQGWLSTSPTSGETTTETDQVAIMVDRNDLEVGDYSGSITITTNGGTATIPITLNVVPGPTLSVTSTALDFNASQNTLTFSITNVGTQTLEWNISDNQDWMSVSPTSGSTTAEQDIVTVTVDRNGLAAGDYSGSVTVTSNGGDQVVTVSMAVAPELSVSANQLDFGLTNDQLSFNITNTGQGVLSWSISDDQAWISVSPTSGSTTTETDPTQVTVDRTGLSAGDYSGTVTVTSDGGNEAITVSMSVPAPPLLAVNPTSLDFGASETSLSVTITNGGDQTLEWSVSDNQDWMSVSPTSGSTTAEQDIVTVTVDRNGLAAGDYSGSVTVTSNGGDQVVAVSMEILPPVLEASTTFLDFGEIETELPFIISNEGTAPLNWSISSNQSWIAVNSSSGTTNAGNPTDVSVTVDRSDSDAGSYSGLIYVQSNGGDATINISMIVTDFPAPTLEDPYNITESSMTLAWSVVDHLNFQEYRLYRSTIPDVDETSTLVTTITIADQNTYDDTDLDNGTTYYYKVYSVSAYGVTAGSNVVSASTPFIPTGSWGLVHSLDEDVALSAIYVLSDDDIWFAGEQNDLSIIYHYISGNFVEITPPNIGEILDIDFNSYDDGWAVSDQGVLHYNGTIWSFETNVTSARDVHVESNNDVWFIGIDGGYHKSGDSFSQLGFSGHAIAVENDFGVLLSDETSNGVYLYNGMSWNWTDVLPDHYVQTTIYHEVEIFDTNKAYIKVYRGGTWGNTIFYFDGVSWGPEIYLAYYTSAIEALNSDFLIACTHSYGPSNGIIHYWDGNESSEIGNIYLNDIDFIDYFTGWGCGLNKVYRYE
jgi:Fe-S cluster assembly iron-binding protein IscA